MTREYSSERISPSAFDIIFGPLMGFLPVHYINSIYDRRAFDNENTSSLVPRTVPFELRRDIPYKSGIKKSQRLPGKRNR